MYMVIVKLVQHVVVLSETSYVKLGNEQLYKIIMWDGTFTIVRFYSIFGIRWIQDHR